MMGPGQPVMECSGEIVCKPLGEFWIVNDMQGDAFGDPMRGIQRRRPSFKISTSFDLKVK
jgi:hypothetical protein